MDYVANANSRSVVITAKGKLRISINDMTYMQDFAKLSSTERSAVLESMTTNTGYNLKDSRDNQIYTIKKLQDGNLWMTRDLAIGCNGSGSNYGASHSAKTLTSANSNVVTNYTTPTTNVHATCNNNDNGVSCNYNPPYMLALQTCSSTYGAYYNLAAATAGTIKGSSNTKDSVYDICPAGWHLPSFAEYQGIASYTASFNMVAAGIYGNHGSQFRYSTSVAYWTRTFRNTYTHYTASNAVGTFPTDPNMAADDASPVRCILK